MVLPISYAHIRICKMQAVGPVPVAPGLSRPRRPLETARQEGCDVASDDFYCMHSEICKTLANEKRQRILDALRDGELSVSQLRDRTGIPQATLSQHLGILRSKGVVLTRREGSRVFYTLTSPKIIQAFDLISEVMAESLDARVQTVEGGMAAEVEGLPAGDARHTRKRRK
jgi:DNA-binding transcriptional ArsR family regulator